MPSTKMSESAVGPRKLAELMMRTELGAVLGCSRTETPTNWIAEEGSAG